MLINSICWYKRSNFSVHTTARKLPSKGNSGCNQPSTMDFPGWLVTVEDPFPAENSAKETFRAVGSCLTSQQFMVWLEEKKQAQSCPACAHGQGADVPNHEKEWDALWQVCCWHAPALQVGIWGRKTIGLENLWAQIFVVGGPDPFACVSVMHMHFPKTVSLIGEDDDKYFPMPSSQNFHWHKDWIQ